MRKKQILIFSVLSTIMIISWLFLQCEIRSITRSELDAYSLSWNKVNKLQTILNHGGVISRRQAMELFSPVDITKNECYIEMKLREYYKDYNDSDFSLLCVLLTLFKDNFLNDYSKENVLKIKQYNYNNEVSSQFAWNFGFLILPNKENKNLIFIKLDKITGKIDLEHSYIGNKNMVDLLELNDKGKVMNAALELKFLNKLKSAYKKPSNASAVK